MPWNERERLWSKCRESSLSVVDAALGGCSREGEHDLLRDLAKPLRTTRIAHVRVPTSGGCASATVLEKLVFGYLDTPVRESTKKMKSNLVGPDPSNSIPAQVPLTAIALESFDHFTFTLLPEPGSDSQAEMIG